MTADCHVRKLNIRTGNKACVPHMTFVLEDALRTASFPGMPANGLVCIRMMDLGIYDPSISSSIIARKMDDLLRNTRPVIITENAPDQPLAPVVWFPDELSPYRFMVKLISENHRPLSWYWQTTVKGWNQGLSANESCHLILSHVSGQKTGIHGLSFVLEPLFKNMTIHNILHALGPEQASRLLINMNLKPNYDFKSFPSASENIANLEVSNELSSSLSLSPSVSDTVHKALHMWSVFDPRMLLFSYLVLNRMGQKTDPCQMNLMLSSLVDSLRIPHDTHTTASTPGNDAEIRVEDAVPLKNKRVIVKRDNPQDMPEEIHPTASPPTHGDATDADDMEKVIPIISRNESHIMPEKNIVSIINPRETRILNNDNLLFQSSVSENRSRIQDTHKTKDHANASMNALDHVTQKETDKKNSLFTSIERDGLTEIWPLFGGFAGEMSGYAGLIFLIPLLKRLGMDTLIETYPEYEDLKLAERIIFRCAELLKMPSHDPALCFMGKRPKASEHFIAFTAPLEWQRLFFPLPEKINLRSSRITGMPGYRLLMDDKVRLILGLWHSKNRLLMAPWLESAQRPLQQACPRSWSIDHLVNNIILAMSRYVRIYANMGLSDLIKRPAYIATTRTHLDVSIPFNRLAVRIRVAGIDIDPGWVPWLGRVIRFHYVGWEQ